MAAIGSSKPVPEKYRSTIFGDAPSSGFEANRRRATNGSFNPITGEVYSSVDASPTGSTAGDVVDAAIVADVHVEEVVVQKQQPQPEPSKPMAPVAAPQRRVPPGGFSTLHLG